MLKPADWNKFIRKKNFNRNDFVNEKLRHQEISRWIIHPYSNFRFFWDLLMSVLLIANVIYLPIVISFFNDHWNQNGLFVFNLLSDSLFLLDILINFRSGKYQIFWFKF